MICRRSPASRRLRYPVSAHPRRSQRPRRSRALPPVELYVWPTEVDFEAVMRLLVGGAELAVRLMHLAADARRGATVAFARRQPCGAKLKAGLPRPAHSQLNYTRARGRGNLERWRTDPPNPSRLNRQHDRGARETARPQQAASANVASNPTAPETAPRRRPAHVCPCPALTGREAVRPNPRTAQHPCQIPRGARQSVIVISKHTRRRCAGRPAAAVPRIEHSAAAPASGSALSEWTYTSVGRHATGRKYRYSFDKRASPPAPSSRAVGRIPAVSDGALPGSRTAREKRV